MSFRSEYVAGVTTHARRGAIANAFRYGVDYVLIEPEANSPTPRLFSRNRFNLASVHDKDHGGPLHNGTGAAWARDQLAKGGLDSQNIRLLLLTQPRFLRYGFNPVSFWLAMDGEMLVAVIAEVSTPFGDRHSYLCHRANFAPIEASSQIETQKSLHVSPFQRVQGTYGFRFDIRADRIKIRIEHRDGNEGVIATLTGSRTPMTSANLIRASLRRPLGPLRTSILIHWQALRLKLKGAQYRTRPTPPENEVT